MQRMLRFSTDANKHETQTHSAFCSFVRMRYDGIMSNRLIERSVTRMLPAYRQVLDVFFEAFPAEERFPVWQLNFMALNENVEFITYFDGSILAGFTYSVVADDYLYLIFLAVPASARSKGYGSRILAQVQEDHPDLVIVLDIEPLDLSAPNYEQRASRLRFYGRNGFSLTGYDLYEDTMRYTVLSNSQEFDAVAFEASMNNVLHGEFPVVLKSSFDLTGE